MSEPSRRALPELREAFLDQLAYLIDEVEALRPVVGRVPEPLLEGRPMKGDRSLKEMYGLLAAADENVYLPQFQRMVLEEEPHFDALDEDRLAAQEPWNEYAIEDILQRVQEGRRRLLAFLQGLPAADWLRTAHFGGERLDLLGRVYQIIQHNTDYLRAMGYRLHESHLTSRPQDLPK